MSLSLTLYILFDKKFFLPYSRDVMWSLLTEWEGLVADVERTIRELRDEIATTKRLLKALLITMLLYEPNSERRKKIIELIRKSENKHLDEVLDLLKEID